MQENFQSEKEKHEPLTKEQLEVKQKQEEKKTIDRIIRGVNDTFEKHYKFDELGLEFTIKIKAPNAIEMGRIQAKVAAYLNGMGNYVSEYISTVYSTLAAIRVTGVEVPDCLDDDEKIYNLDILYVIGRDFQQWLNNFQL